MSWLKKPTPVTVCPCKESCVETVPSSNGWISTTEQVPEFGVRGMVYCTEHGVLMGRRTSNDEKGQFWTLNLIDHLSYSIYPREASSRTVSHWKPVPAGPQI